MGIRLTGISTPFGGANWEYKDDKSEINTDSVSPMIKPRLKLKVFISSNCDTKKYKDIRKELQNRIEKTQLADVYVFEREEGSTLSAEEDYILALRDSDVCIFLIDNKDGVNLGVQREIDVARKDKKMSLYYFCDENCKDKTAIELSIMGAKYAKSKTINKFSDLAEHGAQALIDDIVKIYHYYCFRRIVPVIEDSEIAQKTTVVGIESIEMPTIPKTVLKNTDKCKEYILRFVLDAPYDFSDGKTNELDDWGVQFLPTLFEGNSIKQFNVSMFLQELKKHQNENYFKVVEARWSAIQSYYAGNIDECVQKITEALQLAKNLGQPSWVIKDILIDLRNHEAQQGHTRNIRKVSDAQKELSDSDEELYYPILDRINESLQEKYITDLFKERTKSPFSVSINNDLSQYGDMLASSYIVAIYNGSLTHIRRVHDKIKEFSFFLSNKYDDWVFKRNLLMIEIYDGQEREVADTLSAYPEILNNMTAEDAAYIMKFCDNHPLEHNKTISQLIAFGAVGYYLDEDNFKKYSEQIIGGLRKWFEDDNPVIIIGNHIFPCLEKVSYRVSQNELAEICCLLINKQYTRWYRELFHFIATSIDLEKMDYTVKKTLIDHIVSLFSRKEACEIIKNAPDFLYRLRKQDKELTNGLNQKVQECFPLYYNGIYRLETTENVESDMPIFIDKYIKQIEKSNKTQGVNGCYYGYASRDIATIRAILINHKSKYNKELMNTVIHTVAETLLYSKEGAREKLDAVSLLICIVLNYPDDYKRNINILTELYDRKNDISLGDASLLSSNIDELALKISLNLLFSAMDYDVSCDLMENMSYLQNDLATIISVTNAVAEYFRTAETATFPVAVQQIVLQNALIWSHSKSIDIRWNTAKILLGLLRSPENKNIINHQLIHLIDTESLYIKNLIMRNLYRCENIDHKTKEYIISKCEVDPCFVVRMVCKDEKEKANNKSCNQ